MIRVVLRFINSLSGVPTCNSSCERVVELVKGNVYEIWLKCFSPLDILIVVEDVLNKGLVLTEIEFLNGVKVKGFQLDLQVLQELGQYDADVAEGTIVVEYHRRPSEWMKLLPLRRCEIDVEKRRALVELAKPVKISTLFDHGLKLLVKSDGV